MTPRQARIGVDIFTALVAISIGIALAGLTWRLAGDPGQRFGAAPVAARPAKPVDIAPLIALTPFGGSVAAPAASASADQSIVLRGILLAVPQSASSALISVGGAAPQAFYIGQQIGPGTIESIAVDHVILSGSGGRQSLGFPDRNGGLHAAAPAPVSNPTAAQPPSLAGTAAFLSSLGATVGGDGLHIGQTTERTRAAGLQPGDVIQKIADKPVADLIANPAALQAVQSNGSAQMVVMRNGQPVTLTVPTR
ncbi:general secretion pathway protein C [Sphingomonas vulcanisoli]|uniref:General secretion pathway protein C n=1 Tax=Sphingomonas vulcanisoli TaxID=1658060 RepID=A0ABX0TQD5_9SPHN|nr:type II secretion system protein N [Sphingomonas vulcanisoli]NIJ07738.1 general secretion pathway protein C [Sphingomonas vulcanisoli]